MIERSSSASAAVLWKMNEPMGVVALRDAQNKFAVDRERLKDIDETVERYARAGLPRTPRSVQRYCAKGQLDARIRWRKFVTRGCTSQSFGCCVCSL
jgi:hypothetical protein